MTVMLDRPLPHNLEAERAVLGAALLHAEAAVEACDLLNAGHFFRDAHRRIFDKIRGLVETGAVADFVTVKDALLKSGELEEVGGPAYLAGLSDGVPRSTNIKHYAQIVVEKFQLRTLIQTASKLMASAYEASDDAERILASAERALSDLSEGITRGEFVRLGDLLPELLEKFEKWQRDGTGITGLATGFADLDSMTGGLQPADLIIVAARPSMGKSALAENIGKCVARRGGTVGMYSLEMEKDSLAQRALLGEASIDSRKARRGKLEPHDWRALLEAAGRIGDIPFFIDDEPNANVRQIRAKARRLKAEHGLALIIIDYTQLMDGDEELSENRALQIAQITRSLKKLAKELRVPIVALSQLSRRLEDRQDKRPILADLRESGAIEQDADLVLFIYRPIVYHLTPVERQHQGLTQLEYETLAEVILAKQRNGPTGTVELNWFRESTTFTNRATRGAATQGSMSEGWQ